jgi:lysozyme
MKTNKAGLDLLKSFEGLRLKTYKCSAGVDTIGYGHTSMAGEPKVTPGMTITEQEAEDILARDIGKYEEAVDKAITVAMTGNQNAAMTSLCYNIGPANFAKSSVVRHHNEGHHDQAAAAFLMWNKAAGKVLAGLTRRREAEKKLYLTKDA